ncbi:WD40 repeat-like protein, partial [Clavulina sp. PMI_390]
KSRLKTSFKKSKVIAPLHTSGPVAITKDGTRLLTCVGEQILCTDIASGVEICRFKGDNSDITSLCVSPASTHLAAFYGSMTLRIFDLPPPASSSSRPNIVQPTRTISKCHDAPVHVCRVDPSSTLLASGSADGVVKVWDLQRGYVTHMFKGHGGVVSALAFNYPRETSSTASYMSDSRFHLITGSADTRIRVFDLTATSTRGTNSKPIDVLEGHVSVPRGLDVTSDGRWLISGGRDAVVIIWDLNGGAAASKSQASAPSKGKGKASADAPPRAILVKTIPVLERVEAVGAIAASEVVASSSSAPKTVGRLRFYTGGQRGQIRIWDATDAKVLASFGTDISSNADPESEDPREILEIIYTPSTSTISSIHGDQNIVTYSIPLGHVVKQHIGFNDEIIDARLLSSASTSSSSSTFSSPPSILALATNSSLIRVYDSATLDARLLSSHTDMVLCLDASIDGDVLVSASKDKSARVWVHSALSKPDSESSIATSSSSLDWACAAVAEGHAESVGAIVLSRKDSSSPRFMITGSQDRTVKMWEITSAVGASISVSDTPEKLKSLLTLKAHDKDINSLDIAPNDRLLATGSQDKTANIYEIEFVPSSLSKGGTSARGALKLIGTCKGHKRGVWCVKFSRTERFVATASGDKTVKLWSLDDFSCLKTFEGHTNTVLRVDFITDGQQLVSSASDGLVKVWNIKDEECVTSLDNHEDKIWALAVSRDESTIISGAADSVVTFWTDCTEEVLLEKESARADLILKEQDFLNFVQIRDYRSAILLALTMNQPGRLLSLFKSLRALSASVDDGSLTLEDATSLTGSAAVDEVVRTLRGPELVRLLVHIRDWNTSARTSGVAQGVLHAVLKLRSAEDVMQAFEAQSKGSTSPVAPPVSLKELVDGLLPYSERHLARADQLVQDSYVVDYILSEMDMGMLALDDQGEAEDDGEAQWIEEG